MAVTVRDFDPVALMQFARGFDSLAGEVRGTAVIGTPGPPTGGTQTSFKLLRLDEVEDLDKTLEIDTSARVQIKLGQGSGRTKFLSQLKVHEYSVYVVVAVRVIVGTRQLQGVKLDPESAQLLTTEEGKEQFRKQFGDEFLSGITSGGEFVGLLEIETKDRTDHQEIRAKFSGGVTTGMAEGTATLDSVITEIKSKHQLRVFSFQTGGSDPNAALTPEALVQKAANFPGTVDGEDVFDFLATFESYDILPRPPSATLIEVQNQRAALEKLGLLMIQLQRKADAIDYVLLNKEQFVAFDSAEQLAQRNKLVEAINGMVSQAMECSKDRTKCEFPPLTVDPAAVTLPERLERDARIGLEDAKKAAAEAQGHAMASKTHAARVLEINQTIQTGPQGKKLVDEAKVELANAVQAAQLAQDASNRAIVAGNATPAAGEFVVAAKAAVQQAEDAVKLAKDLQDNIRKIGLAPFWTGPTQLKMEKRFDDVGLPFYQFLRFVSGNVPSTFTESKILRIEKLTEDPGGGEVIPGLSCNVPVQEFPGKQSFGCPIEEFPLKFEIKDVQAGCGCFLNIGTNQNKEFRHILIRAQSGGVPLGNSPLDGKELTTSIKLTSTKSNLSTIVKFKLFCNSDASILGPFLDAVV